MRLHEAIEKAGEGGKIKRNGKQWGCVIPTAPYPENYKWKAFDGYEWVWYPDDITADDWEVVEDKPVIEVGDVVKRSGQGCEIDECKVLMLSKGRVTLGRISHPCGCDEDIRDLTLIRKGPKVYKRKVEVNGHVIAAIDGKSVPPQGRYDVVYTKSDTITEEDNG